MPVFVSQLSRCHLSLNLHDFHSQLNSVKRNTTNIPTETFVLEQYTNKIGVTIEQWKIKKEQTSRNESSGCGIK